MANKDSRAKINFAIACEGLVFPLWQANAIKKLLAVENAQCCLLILSPAKSGQTTSSVTPIGGVFWKWYARLAATGLSSQVATDMSPFFEGVERVCLPDFGEARPDDAEKDLTGNAQLDFILQLGSGPVSGRLLATARYGMFSFEQGDVQKYGPSLSAFWEIYQDEPVTISSLVMRTCRSSARTVLRKGCLKSHRSYFANMNELCLESSKWPAQVCLDILHGNTSYLDDGAVESPAAPRPHPTGLQVSAFFLMMLYRKTRDRLKYWFYADHWNIGVVDAPIAGFLQEENHSPVQWFPGLSQSHFVADPFGVWDGESLHIFNEVYPYRHRKGILASTCYRQGKFSGNDIVIDEPYHMSYPYLVRHEGEIFIVPETWEANQVMLYAAADFPRRWVKKHVLLRDFAGVDNTILYHDGTWWLFTMDMHDGPHHNLNLFYSDSLFGVWQPHPQNPVKTDVRSARPAGTPFYHEGELFRPSMDYSRKNQGSITINKVTKMTKTEYRESCCRKVTPYSDTSFPDKIHTLSQAGKHTIVDGCKEIFVLSSWEALKYKLKGK